MKEKTVKSISKLLVAVMIATIALPSGAFAGHGNYKQDKVMAAEVSIADSEQETIGHKVGAVPIRKEDEE